MYSFTRHHAKTKIFDHNFSSRIAPYILPKNSNNGTISILKNAQNTVSSALLHCRNNITWNHIFCFNIVGRSSRTFYIVPSFPKRLSFSSSENLSIFIQFSQCSPDYMSVIYLFSSCYFNLLVKFLTSL